MRVRVGRGLGILLRVLFREQGLGLGREQEQKWPVSAGLQNISELVMCWFVNDRELN